MTDPVPTIIGVLLVAVVAGLALLPLLRGTPPQPLNATMADPAEVERFGLYRQVLELEFDQQTGKLSREDYDALSRDLLARAGASLRTEHTEQAAATEATRTVTRDVDAEVEREIAAARKAFAQARRSDQATAEEIAS